MSNVSRRSIATRAVAIAATAAAAFGAVALTAPSAGAATSTLVTITKLGAHRLPALTANQLITVTGTGFDAGTTVTATLPSRNGAVLGTGVADANGAVSITFTVPVLLAQGTYPVELTAVDGEKALTSFALRPAYQDALLIILRFLTTHR